MRLLATLSLLMPSACLTSTVRKHHSCLHTSQSSFSAARRQSGELAAYLPLIIVALLALVFGLQVQHKNANTPEELPDFERVILLPTPRALSAFSLLDENGDEFTNDVCQRPMELAVFWVYSLPGHMPNDNAGTKECTAASWKLKEGGQI